MNSLTKSATIHFDPSIHHALMLKAAATRLSISELIDEAVRNLIKEDQEDLKSIAERANDPEISYEELLDDLRTHDKI